MPAKNRVLKQIAFSEVSIYGRSCRKTQFPVTLLPDSYAWQIQLRAASTTSSATADHVKRIACSKSSERRIWSWLGFSSQADGRQKQATPSIPSIIPSSTAFKNSDHRWIRKQISPVVNKKRVRLASTVSPVTAVNAKKEIPAAFQQLHTALKNLEQQAGLYVDTSQLKLAQRSIESEAAITRVAVLGLNGQAGARRLARALLADPLAQEQPWEKQLLDSNEESDGRGILLRHGEYSVDERHPLVRTFRIPSPILSTHKLEILVYTTTSANEATNERAATLLVPQIDAPNSIGGRLTTITYPVHKALIYQECLNSFGAFSAIEVTQDQRQDNHTLQGVIDWSWSTSLQQTKDRQPVSPINLALAESSIETIRKSLDKSLEYEHQWFDAGMPALSAWLTEGIESRPDSLKPAVRSLIEIICETAELGIQREARVKAQQVEDSATPIPTRNALSQQISLWVERAHTELRDRLNSAFGSKSWRKTRWWKLFWRVDDVSYIASDILRGAWLVDAEKEMIWISGRIHQSGLLGSPDSLSMATTAPTTVTQEPNEKYPASSIADLRLQEPTFTEPAPASYPWPQEFSRARSTLSSVTVPPFQALSQTLLIQTLSTNVLASSLAALVYISISTTSPYESGAIAATGLVWSLRRLQKRWELARRQWEVEVKEEGRRVLRNVESLVRQSVENYQPPVDTIGIEKRAVAAKAVGNVTSALAALKTMI